MPITIGSNIPSLLAQRSLAQSSDEVGRTLERLSSGMRINRASDDAAGLSLANALDANRRLYSTAVRNISDALSMVGIASGVLDQQSAILGRLAELAEQSANGSYSNGQRSNLNREFQELVGEMGRLGDTALFNGNYLLRGNRSNGLSLYDIQAGINGSASARITARAGDTASFGGVVNWDSQATADWNGLDGVDVSDIFEYNNFISSEPSTDELHERFQGQVYYTEFTDSSGQSFEVAVGLVSGTIFGGDASIGNQVAVQAFYRPKDSDDGWQVTGESFTDFSNGSFNVDSSTGRIIGDAVFGATIGSSQFTLNFSGLEFASLGSGGGNGSVLEFSGVDTSDRALDTIGVIRSRLNELGEIRGRYGAFESRLQSALFLSVGNGEVTAQARSRIIDADIALESAELARRTILQQAGAAVLAQANAQPQLALLLLST